MAEGQKAMPAMSQADADALIARGISSPQRYWEDILGIPMYGRQGEILDAVENNPKVAIAGCNSSGKTFSMTPYSLWKLTTAEKVAIMEIAPTEKQSHGVYWRDMRGVYRSSPLAMFLLGKAEMHRTSFEVSDYRYAAALTPGDEMSLRGYHADEMIYVLDEGNGIDAEFFDAIAGTQASGSTKIIQLGNPTANSGIFYDCCQNPDLGWHVMHISAFDSPNIQSLVVPDWFDEECDLPGQISQPDRVKLAYLEHCWHQWIKKRDRTPTLQIPEYKVLTETVTPYLTTRMFVADGITKWGRTGHSSWWGRVLGEFPPEAANQLISREWLDRAGAPQMYQRVVEDGREQRNMIWGMDPAGMGQNEFALVGVQFGWDTQMHHVIAAEGFYGENALDQACSYMAPYMRNTMWINVDRTGVGERATIDTMRWAAQYHVPVGQFGSSWKSTNPKVFRDMKAQAYAFLRDLFIMGYIDGVTDPILRRQLLSLHYKPGTRSFEMESKKDMEKRGVDSPDRADALAYAVLPLLEMTPQRFLVGAA